MWPEAAMRLSGPPAVAGEKLTASAKGNGAVALRSLSASSTPVSCSGRSFGRSMTMVPFSMRQSSMGGGAGEPLGGAGVGVPSLGAAPSVATFQRPASS